MNACFIHIQYVFINLKLQIDGINILYKFQIFFLAILLNNNQQKKADQSLIKTVNNLQKRNRKSQKSKSI